MSIIRILFVAILVFGAGSHLQAQPNIDSEARKEAISQARYLKSIYKTDEAIDLLAPYVSQDSFDEEVLAELADCHFQSADYETAAGSYFMLASRFPKKVLYKIRLMQSFYRLHDYANSIEAGKAVLQLDTIPAVLTLIGDAFRTINMPDSALAYYTKSLAVKPENESVVTKSVNILIKSEKYDDAIAVADSFLVKDPDNFAVTPLKGIALYRKEDYNTAREVLMNQKELGNDSYPVHYYLGQACWQIKEYHRAEVEFMAAWQIDSSDVNLAYSIAAVGAECYRPFERDIKPWLDKVEEMTRPDPSLMSRMHQQYGRGYSMQTSQYAKAAEHYKEALKYSPDAIVLYYAIGYCYELNKEFKNALKWYEKYLSVCPKDSRGYKETLKSIEFVKAKIFMEEPKTEK